MKAIPVYVSRCLRERRISNIYLYFLKHSTNRPNGMPCRSCWALKTLSGPLFRFTGGCIVKRQTGYPQIYQWKNTSWSGWKPSDQYQSLEYISPEEKFLRYYQSYSLGFFSLLESWVRILVPNHFLYVELQIHPVWVLKMMIRKLLSVNHLQPYIDDALIDRVLPTVLWPKWGKLCIDIWTSILSTWSLFYWRWVFVYNLHWEEDLLYYKGYSRQIISGYQVVLVVPAPQAEKAGTSTTHGLEIWSLHEVDLVDEHYYRSQIVVFPWKSQKRYDSPTIVTIT